VQAVVRRDPGPPTTPSAAALQRSGGGGAVPVATYLVDGGHPAAGIEVMVVTLPEAERAKIREAKQRQYR
jgi:hypothetical protein